LFFTELYPGRVKFSFLCSRYFRFTSGSETDFRFSKTSRTPLQPGQPSYTCATETFYLGTKRSQREADKTSSFYCRI